MRNEKLVMPSSCITMDEEEMMYVEGGKGTNIDTLPIYLSRSESKKKAEELKDDGFCTNMSVTDIAKEIHGHAVWGYGMIGPSVMNTLPSLVREAAQYISECGLNGITLGDDCDVWYRVAAYNVAWPMGIA